MEQRNMRGIPPAEALRNHTVPHSGATCSEGASEKGAGLEDCKDW